MAKDTKERILMAALDMFSKKGYEFVFYQKRKNEPNTIQNLHDASFSFVET